ncbi:microfibril-associated glycoprotein 4 isoform X1 [Takifugu rubripes]|uniref:microfibril-associated glycoprotein 4 isoform X1 n=1 Tax=Takifugu rubripes TaxID=31033 RepID=UPI001145A004|nr:microfibril-associated glycoprotein 4-like isoform X1 [Takifugu rubripes]XP_029705015.1 microfibril-associated glycoprotein 4-like isoform X1 [Takifugu rubripes]XP_029705016.1 microfibril-associated glycoprotein 4-like isoform X1 [Takifugu rubripes]
MSILSLTNPAGWTGCSALFILIVLLPEAASDAPNATSLAYGGGSQCGEYTNQVMDNGMCRLVATLPQLDEQKCPDMFRCTEEVSYWLHENEESKQQIAALKETISELQEELRNHRHRIKVLELQHEETNHINVSLEHRFHELEVQHTDATTLLHLQGTLIIDLQNQLHNLTLLVDQVQRNHGCLVNIGHPNTLMNTQEALHSGTPFSTEVNVCRTMALSPSCVPSDVQHVRSCPIDCASIYYNGVRRSGLYTIVPSLAAMPLEVYCDMDTDGGGWTVIQRRVDGSVSFDRNWRDYRDGFGDLHSEFWLGNEHIHELSAQGEYSLRIHLEDWSNKHKHALYQRFSVEDEEHQYRLHVSGFTGTVQDSFSWYHDEQSFSTPDSGNICAEISHSGWWYNQCFYANLNGFYYRGGRYTLKTRGSLGPDGIVWYSWKDSDYYSLRKVSMMIRPRNFRAHMSP